MDFDVNHSHMEVDSAVKTKKDGNNKRTRLDKSKLAAKSRRDKENIEMQKLIEELPFEESVLNKMDKTSVIKIAISYIKMKHFVQKEMKLESQTRGLTEEANCSKLVSLSASPSSFGEMKLPEENQSNLMLEALNGFLMFISKKGKVMYVSPTVEEFLGVGQAHVINNSVLEYIHPEDKPEFTKQFNLQRGANCNGFSGTDMAVGDSDSRLFYVRMKYVFTKSGNSKSKQTGYTLVQWSGKLKTHWSLKCNAMVTDGLLCVCRPMQTTSIMEIRMDGNMFMSRHNLDMKFTFCDTRILTLIGYEPSEVVGKSAYHFHNPIDARKVGDCHSNLIVKGTSVSKYYRFIGKTGRWVWLQTRATIIYNTSNKPQYVVAMNYVVSEEEGERYMMLESSQNEKSVCQQLDTAAAAQSTVQPAPANILEHSAPTQGTNELPSQAVTCSSVPPSTTVCNTIPPVNNHQPSLLSQTQSTACHWPAVMDVTSPLQDPACKELGEAYYPAMDSCLSNNTASEDAGYESSYSPSSASSSFHHSPCSQSDQGIDIADKDLTQFQCGGSTTVTGTFTTEPALGVHVPMPNAVASDSLDLLGSGSYGYNTECFNGNPMMTGSNTSASDRMDMLDELLESFCQPTNGITNNNTSASSNQGPISQTGQVTQQQHINSSVTRDSNLVSATSGSPTFVSSINGSSNGIRMPARSVAQQQAPSKTNSPPKPGGKSLLRSLFDMEARDIRPPLSLSSTVFKKDAPVSSTTAQPVAATTASVQGSMLGEQKLSVGDALSEFNKADEMLTLNSVDKSLDESTEIPVDLSDFALQYLESLPEAQTSSMITDLESDNLMDIDEHDLSTIAFEFTQMVTQPQDVSSYAQSSEGVGSYSSMSRGGYKGGNRVSQSSLQATMSDLSSKSLSSCSVQQQQQQTVNTNGMRNNYQNNRKFSSPPQDHGYYQLPTGLRTVSNNGCQVTTPATKIVPQGHDKGSVVRKSANMSELEKRLRGIGNSSCSKGSNSYQQQRICKPLLQMFLTGELSKDKYHQMEQERYSEMCDSSISFNSG